MNRISTWTAVWLLAVMAWSAAWGQAPAPPGADAQKKSAPARQVRFLALGEAPPFRQEIRNGVRYELPPPPGSVPPAEVTTTPGEKEKTGEPAAPIRLNLGRISAPVGIPQGAGPLELRKSAAGGDSRPWLGVQRPETGDLLVVIWRDPQGRNWDQVKTLVLPDGQAAGGGITLLNLAPETMAVTLGSEKIALPHGRPLGKDSGSAKETALEVSALGPDGRTAGRRFQSTTLSLDSTERTLVIIFRADGEKPRMPVKVTILRERVVPVP